MPGFGLANLGETVVEPAGSQAASALIRPSNMLDIQIQGLTQTTAFSYLRRNRKGMGSIFL
jgi:hypothetical protein